MYGSQSVTNWTSLGGGWSWLVIQNRGNKPLEVLVSTTEPLVSDIGVEYQEDQNVEVAWTEEDVWVRSRLGTQIIYLGVKAHVG